MVKVSVEKHVEEKRIDALAGDEGSTSTVLLQAVPAVSLQSQDAEVGLPSVDV